ncbi:polysaccharide pyruvyl transferase family protein [Cellulomonas xylanilytica]|uniref:Polysaccharide pyruvyl transferase domain-containing protein n=1 Tax=Cellulomonas xylanilytica TaxID=233583 RepID=A0A510V366_9CELL|nr:polysaccharide pyruvyl transferase family protein [Cellulomonas xylanilytica]GEK21322.1 hypothetical protein CXY01_18420 [Cellulomonas xylanilytica]
MRVLVAWSDDRSRNLGVRALAHGSAALARRAFGDDCEVEFQNFGKGASPVPVGSLRSLAREHLDRHQVRDWLASFDLVVDTRSGDSFADIYGTKRLATMSAFADLARRAKVPVVLGPQTIGPFGSRVGRAIARHSMRTATLTMARDPASAAAAHDLGRDVDVLTTDVVFALPAPARTHTRDVLLNVSGLLWDGSPHVDGPTYRRTVDTLTTRLLAAGRRVTLLAHVLDSPLADNDVPAVQDVARAHPEVDVAIPTDLDDVRSIIASSELVIGSRMHACLNALSIGVPALPLAYSRKFAPLLDSLGWSSTVDLRTSSDPAGEVLAHLDDPELPDRAGTVQQRAAELLRPAEDALRTALRR